MQMGSDVASKDPRDRVGVYQRFDDVPEHYRFGVHADAYEGRDVWDEFEARRLAEFTSDSFRQKLERAGRRWREHMADRGRHHALARPADVEAFFADLLDELTVLTAYEYYIHVSAFYDWLLWHADHPHLYDPVKLAAIEGGASRRLFDFSIRPRERNRS